MKVVSITLNPHLDEKSAADAERARAGFVPIVNARKQANKKRKDGDANATPPPQRC